MSEEIEIEFKNMLTQAEYDLIYQSLDLSHVPAIYQVNSYFDQEAILADHGIAVRLRLADQQAEITLKHGQLDHQNIEINQPISLSKAQKIMAAACLDLPDTLVGYLNKVGIDNLYKLKQTGRFQTKRYQVNYQDQLLVLDQVNFGTSQDYELEMEVNDYELGSHTFNACLDYFKIPRRPSQPKVKRMKDSIN
ncbi:hypothetical protein AWM75_06380 [Aerococcus urinaehominis]|uniref:Uncharacterized protein n=1 Tax=Aerococcus urinaehominis TaxID=128944 RepID=A0A0X8FLQ0_9LACT|nr:CYTH domain-containing protein [Aerococcus urinaehominis]AMB99632.1 hypothetical protein AWM75_06380 [Aerococcus urinaehominis]SDL88123.1 Uncharacterized protein YjbK [Aerococcus urinaehominis]